MDDEAHFGCLQVDDEARHFGAVKESKITGLGLRIGKKTVESGKYHGGKLNGLGQRIEFGKQLYWGYFKEGTCGGEGKILTVLLDIFNAFLGVLFDWEKKMRVEGIFANGKVLQKSREEFFIMSDLDKFRNN